MSKSKKNSFEILCDKLEENYIVDRNEITYVRKFFTSSLKISEDKDMLFKLKVEAEDSDYYFILSLIVSITAMVFTAIGVIIQLLPQMQGNINNIVKIVYLILVIISTLPLIMMFKRKFRSVEKWKKYVLFVIDELIENQSKTESKNQEIENKNA